MKRRNLPLHALRAFEATARAHSVSRAADELGVTHSAVSHQIKKLEELTGSTLFDRKHKPLRLTVQGEQLLSPVSDAFDRLARSTNDLKDGGLEGDLTVSCVPGLGANWLVPILGEFLKTYAKLRVRVITEFWHQPIEENDADLAVAYGSAQHAGKRVIHLGHSNFFPVCSPPLFADSDAIRNPEDLLRYTMLHDHSEESWQRWFVAAGVRSMSDARGIVFDSAHLSLQAARAGCGIAMGDTPTVHLDLKEGRLIRPFDRTVPAIHPYYIVTPPPDQVKPAAQALEVWLQDRFADLRRS